MGQGANGVGAATRAAATGNTHSPREEARRLEGEIGALREDLGTLVAELDRRRHELMDVKLQLRRHARAVAITGAGLAAGTAMLIVMAVRRSRARRRRPPTATEWLRDVAVETVLRPDRIAGLVTSVLSRVPWRRPAGRRQGIPGMSMRG